MSPKETGDAFETGMQGHPLNPNDINIKVVPKTIGQIVDMLASDEMLIPAFQRAPNLWNPKQKSRFIESLMLNLPIPLFYFAEGEDKKWAVIDGLQRISTLAHFILGGNPSTQSSFGHNTPFRLQDLEFRPEFNGKAWKELPRDVQRRIQTNQVIINLIAKGTPNLVKFNIFSRINQGSVSLKSQEIRTALYQGFKADFLQQLISEDTDAGRLFLKATNRSVSTKRQEDLDYASRFVAFYLLGYQAYASDMDTFLNLGMKALPHDSDFLQKIAEDFGSAMQLAHEVFGTNSFRKHTSPHTRSSAVNKALFEIISVGFAKLTPAQRLRVLQSKEAFQDSFLSLLCAKDFVSAVGAGSASKERVYRRHRYFEKLLNQFTA